MNTPTSGETLNPINYHCMGYSHPMPKDDLVVARVATPNLLVKRSKPTFEDGTKATV